MTKYYELRFRTMRFEGKGDPAGFNEVTYIRSENKNEVLYYVNHYGVELIDTSKDPYADGFYIAELTPERFFDTRALEIKVNEERHKKQ